MMIDPLHWLIACLLPCNTARDNGVPDRTHAGRPFHASRLTSALARRRRGAGAGPARPRARRAAQGGAHAALLRHLRGTRRERRRRLRTLPAGAWRQAGWTNGAPG